MWSRTKAIQVSVANELQSAKATKAHPIANELEAPVGALAHGLALQHEMRTNACSCDDHGDTIRLMKSLLSLGHTGEKHAKPEACSNEHTHTHKLND